MRLLITGGGTGGHLFPALAVARAFAAEHPAAEILVVGKRGGPEESLVPEAGFRLETIAVRGLDRDAPLRNLALPAVIPLAFRRGLGLVRAFRPDVVLGMGGYVMAPAVWGARRAGVPYVLHEKDVRPGLATRMFARGAAVVCTTLPGTDVRLGAAVRTELTGVPIRPGFERRVPSAPARRLLVTGGSQGARRLNLATWEALPGLLERFEEVIHVAGRQGAGEVVKLAAANPRYTGMAFASDMPALMARADLVVSRAGIGTIGEITNVGLPSILVPGLFGGAHQELNAAALVEAGAAVRLGDAELTGAALLAAVDGLDEARLRAMAAAAAALGRPDAAMRVVRVLERVAAA